MKAVRVERPGGPEVLAIVDVPEPLPGPGEVRVRLAAIGVNYADVLCRRATHRSMRPPPLICGCEGAGVVDACGPGVVRHRVGDRVGVYSPFGGAYAESLLVPEAYALPLPDAMSFDDAAAFTHVALTAHAALTAFGPVVPGAVLLVTAAAGGLGGLVCQLGVALGLAVIAATGSATKRDLLVARGYAAIDYGAESLVDAVLARTGGRGADLVVETVGGALFAQATAALAPVGRIVIAGAASGALATPDPALLLDRSATCATLNLSVLFAARPAAMHDAWAALVGLYGAGLLRSRISRRYALSDAASAHRLLESRTSVDKLLLVP